MVFMGIGLAFCFATLGTLVIDYSKPGETGVASGMNTIMRTIGGAIGGQVAASIIAATVVASDLPTERGFTIAFTISAAALFVSFLSALAVPRKARPVQVAVAEAGG
jgi:hypothetical protein